MGISNRLRERREQLGLTQGEVASKLGITPGAVGNYENGVSTPKADILFKVFDALKCDANYLFQDEMKNLKSEDSATPYEMDNIIKKYRALDDFGKDTVQMIVDREYHRCVDYSVSLPDGSCVNIESRLPNSPSHIIDVANRFQNSINAAHSRTDKEVTNEDMKHDEDIMNDDNF